MRGCIPQLTQRIVPIQFSHRHFPSGGTSPGGQRFSKDWCVRSCFLSPTSLRGYERLLSMSPFVTLSTGLSRRQCTPGRLARFYSYVHPVLSSPRPPPSAYSDRSYYRVSDRTCLLVHNRRDYSDPHQKSSLPTRGARAVDRFLSGLSNHFPAGQSLVTS